jgi:hypothetical protein
VKTNNLKIFQTVNFRKLKKPIAICISALFIISMLSVFSLSTVQAATVTTFGNSAVGTYLDQNDPNAQSISYFTSTTTGSVTDIIAYISGASSGKAITALYQANGNSAGALLEQSNSANIGTTYSWVDFQLPTPYTVTAGTTYGLAIMGNVPVSIVEVAGSGQRAHNGASSYANGFANPFGAIWGTDNSGAMSIYATGTGTNSPTPTPSPSPTPTPTTTQTAPPTSNQVTVSTATASSYDSSHTPNLAIDGVESTSNYWGTNAMITAGKLPQWLQLDLGTQTSISQIITHFYDGDSRTYTYYIQASTDGSTWNTIVPTKTGSSIVTDTFNQITARYVRITITGNTANLAAHIEQIKIYQSANPSQKQTPATTPTPTPTPTPTQTQTPATTPTPTPTPTPTQKQTQFASSSPNLEPLSAFYADMNGAASSYASLDYGTLHNGNPSIRLGPDYVRGSREVDGAWLGVKPGDHIVFSAWVKTASYKSSDICAGIRLGMDFYISSSQGNGIATIDAVGHQAGHPNDAENMAGVARLPWGNDWTLLTWDIYVPTTYYTYVTNGAAGNYGVHSCNPVQISSMVPWLDTRSITDNAYSWFSDTTFYINP